MDGIENLILDMDGVLWRGDTPLPGLPDFFAALRAHGMRYLFATNNASKTPEQYIDKFARFGVAITADQVMTSALATATYLAAEYPAAETAIYPIGDVGLHEALTGQGFTLLGREDYQTEAAAVVVGFTQHVTYQDFAVGTMQIRRGARFIGCNPDATFPSELGLLPGCGSLLALLRAATDKEPTVIGKPGPIIFQECLRRLGPAATGANTAMVGDRLNTDVAGGRAAGLRTILVLSGVSQAAELATSAVQPDYIFDDIGGIMSSLNGAK